MKNKFLSAALCSAFALTATAADITVNGIVTLFGDQRVLFKTGDENNFMLAVGQEQQGIRLLRVEIKKGIAHFDNQGVLQAIAICATPQLISPPEKTAAAKSAPSPGAQNIFDSTSSASISGRENVDKEFQQPLTGSTSQKNSADDSANAGDDSAPADAPHKTKDQNAWWYRAAQQVEEGRRATAASVRAGENPAYPLTPLTPPGTAADLIGPGELYFNHFQRYIGPGLVAKQ